MKAVLIIVGILIISCNHSRSNRKRANAHTSSASNAFHLDCSKPYLEDIIAYTDTIVNDQNYNGHSMLSYDAQKRLRRILRVKFVQNDTRQIYADTQIFDTLGHILFESKSKNDMIWQCYKYFYDSAGRLIDKEGYGSGNFGIKISYQYAGKKLAKEVIVQPTDTVVHEY